MKRFPSDEAGSAFGFVPAWEAGLGLAFSPAQRRHALIWLSFWHVFIIAVSNYLVQFPFEMFGYHTTWGAFSFPFIFLTTDLTIRIFNAGFARRIILCAMIPAFFVSVAMSLLFSPDDGLRVILRICLASFLAYVIGQILDIGVFNRLRQQRRWWVAPSASAIFGNAVDTIAFFGVAFYHSSNEHMAQHWPEIALVDYLWKIIICALFFLPAYGLLLNYLTTRLTRPN